METKIKNNINVVETFAEDMTKAIGENKDGIIKKIIHEQAEHEMEQKNLSPESGRNKTFMFFGLTLIILAVGVMMLLLIFKKEIFTTPVVIEFSPIIFTDQNKSLIVDDLPKDKIAQSVLNEVKNVKLKSDAIESVSLALGGQIIGFHKFSTLIEANIPVNFFNSVSNNFLLGIWQNNLFLLLKTKSFADVFPVLHLWENKILSDLGGFFNFQLTLENNYLLTKDFEDGIVANKNARILKDKDGQVILMYVFVDDDYMLVSNKEEVNKEIITRLVSSKIKK